MSTEANCASVVYLQDALQQEYDDFAMVIVRNCSYVSIPKECGLVISHFVIESIQLIPDILDVKRTDNDAGLILSGFDKYWRVHQASPQKWAGRVAWSFAPNTAPQLLLIQRWGVISKHQYRFHHKNSGEHASAEHISALKLRLDVTLSFEGTDDFVTMSLRAKNAFHDADYGGVPAKGSSVVVQKWGHPRIAVKWPNGKEAQHRFPYHPKRQQSLHCQCTLMEMVSHNVEEQCFSALSASVEAADDPKLNGFAKLTVKRDQNINERKEEEEYGHVELHNREQRGCIAAISSLSLWLDVE